MSVRFWVRLLIAVWGALIFRLTLGPRLAVLGVQPDLMAALVFYLTLARGAVPGILAGFLLGLLVDVDQPDALGLSSLAWCTMAYATARISEALESTDPVVAALLLLLVVLIGETVRCVFVAGADPGRMVVIWLRWVLPTALYTCIVAPLAVALVHGALGGSRWFGGRT